MQPAAQAADSGVAWAADSSSSGNLSSRSRLFKPPLASSTAVNAGSIDELAQAADSGVSWATDSSSSGGLSSSLASRSGLSKSPLASSTAGTSKLAQAANSGVSWAAKSKLAQAADSGVAWAADSGSSGSLSSRGNSSRRPPPHSVRPSLPRRYLTPLGHSNGSRWLGVLRSSRCHMALPAL